MRVLAITKIFPNRLEPLSAPFNRQQFAALARYCELEVLASIPWFPAAEHFARWSPAGKLCAVPKHDRIEGLSVHHPRFLFLPKVGHAISGPLYAVSLLSHVWRYRNHVDVVLGSWAYPDGFAAIVLARLLGVPAVVKLHGSDMNVVARWRGPRQNLAWALPQAARVIAVSEALARAAHELGVPDDRIAVVPNGVDTSRFQPADRGEARRTLALDARGSLILYVGRVVREKGVFDLVRAFQRLAARRRHVRLAMVGDGPDLAECKRQLRLFSNRVFFAGARAHDEIPRWLAACDVLTLPSWNEGMPNVVVEALACGRRVVAANVGAIPDIIHCPLLGEIVARRAPEELASALERATSTPYDPTALRAAAKVIDWDESARAVEANLSAAVSAGTRKAA